MPMFGQPSIARTAAITAVVTSTLFSGVTFTINKLTPTTDIRNENVSLIKSSSGTGVSTDGWGTIRASGAIISDGVQLGTGGVVTSDARYVNTSGDTMTGSLTINLSSGFVGIKILQTASGAFVRADRSLASSGTLTVEGLTQLESTLDVNGNMSGRTIFLNATGIVDSALCRKTDGSIGTCSSVVGAGGTCTCN